MAEQLNASKEIASFLGLVDTYKRWIHFKTKDDRCYEYYHPSEFGKCLRAQQYKHYASLDLIKVEHKEIESKILRLFDKGHNMHKRWVDYFEELGILRGKWKCKNVLCRMFDDTGKIKKDINTKKIIEENKSRVYGRNELKGVFKPEKCVCGCKDFYYLEIPVISEKLKIKGNADVVLDCSSFNVDMFKDIRLTFDPKFLPVNGDMVVADMKSIGQSAWDFQLKKRGAHKSYLIQLICYIHILDCKYGILMYENKNTSELKFYKVDRNDEWWETIEWQSNMMQEMISNKQLPPPRPNEKSSYDCKSCEFASLCHSSSIWKDSQLDKKRKKFYKCLL